MSSRRIAGASGYYAPIRPSDVYDALIMASARREFVRLTGRPSARVGSDEWAFEPDKRYQLLSYLAYHGDWLGRERLAFLFWPDTDTANSRQNLRGLLQRLRSLPFEPQLEVTPQMMRWPWATDVAAFRAAVDRDDPDAAIDAYHGPLLAGIEEDDASEFGDWLQIERDRFHGEWRAVALRRLRECGRDEHQTAERLLRRLLAEDELDEEAVSTYLVTMKRLGRVEEARAQYLKFVKRLDDEMGLEPTSATVAIFESLSYVQAPEPGLTRVVAAADADDRQPPDRTRGARSKPLPRPNSTLIGRQRERSEIASRLRDPSCRLLTILGPGGIGKTRLALAVAHDIAGEFKDGAVFVPLAAVETTDDVPLAVARALGMPLPPSGVLEHLRRALADLELLVILDNCEHLPRFSEVLAAALEAAPGIKVIATTRGRLSLVDEWQYPLDGLPFPTKQTSLEEMLAFPSIELFLERARRVRPTFEIGPGEEEDLAQLGALTEGMPLAIELAAAWARSMSLPEIVGEIGRNLDLLMSSAIDADPRHVSIRATFDQSWAILTEAERESMRRLSVFREGVRSEAALFVAGATRQLVTSLVDKSLLRLRADNRYHQHPLWLAFAREKLALDAAERDQTIDRHAAYYLRFLRERTDSARGSRPAAALSEIDAELADILAAAETARDRGHDEQLIAFMLLLAIATGYMPARGYGPRRLGLLTTAALVAEKCGDLEAAHALRGRLADAYATHQGARRRALGEYRRAAELAQRSGNQRRHAVYLSLSGVMAFQLGNADFETLLDEALAKAKDAGDDLALAVVLDHRAYSLLIRHAHREARDLYEQALEVVARLEESEESDPYELRRLRFFCLLNQGEADLLLGHRDKAFDARREALMLAEESANPIWAAYANQELGEMYGQLGEKMQALDHLKRALVLYEENHVTAHVTRLGKLMVEQGYVAGAAEVEAV